MKLCAGMLQHVAGKKQEVSDIAKDRRTFILVIKDSPSDCLTLNNVHIIVPCSTMNYIPGNTA
jgi:hypothetical protein